MTKLIMNYEFGIDFYAPHILGRADGIRPYEGNNIFPIRSNEMIRLNKYDYRNKHNLS